MEKDFTKIVTPIIKSAGEIMIGAHNVEILDVKSGDVNFVTEYDVKVQNFLVENLKKAFPNATFIAEENLSDGNFNTAELCFIIDPIDGTTNFIKDYKLSAISIGCYKNGVGIFGAVLNPYSNELYTAEKGKGAYLNGNKICVSKKDFNESIFAFGSSPYYKAELGEKTFSIAKNLFFSCTDIRRSGSAALDFCHLAVGRIDLFFECRLSPWDYAAGAIILQEAGGKVTDFDGKPLDMEKPSSVYASNGVCHEKGLEIIKNS
ncbi:MAG: inositol monophosphatase [Clostridiales bacterium]|nr:inositol monophosphatase [Clostridiales bacterium]